MIRNLLLIAVLCFSSLTYAQNEAPKKTDVNKDVDLVVVYEQVVKEGYATPKIYKELANAQYFRNNYKEAKKWFEKLFEVENLSDATLAFRYKQTLKALKLDFTSNQYLSSVSAN